MCESFIVQLNVHSQIISINLKRKHFQFLNTILFLAISFRFVVFGFCQCSTNNCSSEEAVSSMEIDSSANDAVAQHKSLITSPDSYVSTTNIAANEPIESASHAQVLEELRARIRELEGSPLKMRNNHDEEHYKCYICKVSNSFLSAIFDTTFCHRMILLRLFIHEQVTTIYYLITYRNLFVFLPPPLLSLSLTILCRVIVIYLEFRRILKSHARSVKLSHRLTSFEKFMFKTKTNVANRNYNIYIE